MLTGEQKAVVAILVVLIIILIAIVLMYPVYCAISFAIAIGYMLTK